MPGRNTSCASSGTSKHQPFTLEFIERAKAFWRSSLSRRRLLGALLSVAYLSAAYQMLRFYVSYPFFYLRLPEYFSGRERLPFQLRILPIAFLEPLGRNHLLQRFAATRIGYLHNPWRMAFFITSLLFFSVACYFLLKLYRALSTSRRLEFLLLPVFFHTFLWTYVLNVDQHYSYPYDVPSLAFFSAGLYFIYQRRFVPLAVVMLLGTVNREVTLFLIGIYILDAATVPNLDTAASFRHRFNRKHIPWLRVLLLSAIWLAVYGSLLIHFRYNDRSEDYSRIQENLIRLIKVHYWPAMLNICGYLLPFVCLFRQRLQPQRFANYLYILVPWVAIMFYTGVLNETRIFGELCPYTAIAAVLIAEQYLDNLARGSAASHNEARLSAQLHPTSL